jgi:peptidoglycan/xylan/chitin deacetylase (PgdA/CDA1 family)
LQQARVESRAVSVKFLSVFLIAAVALAGAGYAGPDSIASNRPSGPIKVAITVDDIPANGDLPPGVSREDVSRGFLKAFKENGVDHVFGFTIGTFMDNAPEEIGILKEWLIAGYPLGNHTYSHPDLNSVTTDSYLADIAKQDQVLQTLAPFSPLIQKRHMFRYPFLDEGSALAKRNAVRAYLARNGYRIAEVTIDYYDWAWTDAYERCVAKHDDKTAQWLKDHVVEGADRTLRDSQTDAQLLFNRQIPQILLIHISLFNALTLDKILKSWRAKGVQFVSLDEALSDPVYAINPNFVYEGGRGFLEQIAEASKISLAEEDPAYSIESLNKICK